MCFVSQEGVLQGHSERRPISDPELNAKFRKLDLNGDVHTNSKVKTQNCNLSQYLIDKCTKYSLKLEQVKNDYADITANYQISDDEILLSKVDNLFNSSISLTNKTLMKVIYKSNLILSKIHNLDPNAVHEFNITHQNESWKIGAFRNREGKLTVFKYEGTETAKENPNFLGEGSNGIVQKISDFSNAQFIALKTAKSSDRKKINSIKTEVKILSLVKSSGSGLQRGINGPLIFQDGILGCTTQFYNKLSLSNSINELHESISPTELLQLIIDLFDGLKTLHSKGIIHGDIKPANCLLNITSRNDKLFYDVVLGDLGGAVLIRKLLKSTSYMGTAHTGGYFTLTDVIKLKIAHQNNKEEWIEFCKKRDIFALAQTIWFMLTKEKPFQTKESQFVGEKTKRVASTEVLYNIEAVENIIGEIATKVLIRALDEDPSNRPSIDEILDILNRKDDLQIESAYSFDSFESSNEGTCELTNSNSEN